LGIGHWKEENAMRSLIIVATVSALALAVAGCKGRKTETPDKPGGATPAPRATGAGAPTPSAPAGGGATVKECLERAHQAAVANNPEAYLVCLDPAQRKAISDLVEEGRPYVEAMTGLRVLVKEKFGNELAESIRIPTMASRSPLDGAMQDELIDWQEVKIAEHEDSADVKVGRYEQVKLKRIEGRWYLAFERVDGPSAQSRAFAEARMKIPKTLEKGIRDGTVTRDNFKAEYERLTQEFIKFLKRAAPARPE
jgi:hypothetical protein